MGVGNAEEDERDVELSTMVCSQRPKCSSADCSHCTTNLIAACSSGVIGGEARRDRCDGMQEELWLLRGLSVNLVIWQPPWCFRRPIRFRVLVPMYVVRNILSFSKLI